MSIEGYSPVPSEIAAASSAPVVPEVVAVNPELDANKQQLSELLAKLQASAARPNSPQATFDALTSYGGLLYTQPDLAHLPVDFASQPLSDDQVKAEQLALIQEIADLAPLTVASDDENAQKNIAFAIGGLAKVIPQLSPAPETPVEVAPAVDTQSQASPEVSPQPPVQVETLETTSETDPEPIIEVAPTSPSIPTSEGTLVSEPEKTDTPIISVQSSQELAPELAPSSSVEIDFNAPETDSATTLAELDALRRELDINDVESRSRQLLTAHRQEGNIIAITPRLLAEPAVQELLAAQNQLVA